MDKRQTTQHAQAQSTCGSAPNVGAYDGDLTCGSGFLGACEDNSNWDGFATRSGTTSAWFKARVREDSLCGGNIEHRVRLLVPTGVDYDLYVYRDCGGAPVISSANGTGTDEGIIIGEADFFALDDDFDYWVEVRFYSGSTCTPWTLTFDGHDC